MSVEQPFAWPAIDVSAWAPAKRSLHRYAQMLGKLRVALSPSQPNWMFTALELAPRGVRTGPVPWRLGSVEASIDVFSSELIVQRSDGRERRMALDSAPHVAAVYEWYCHELRELGVECTITPIPQEVPDPLPLPEDMRPAGYDPAAVQRWFHAATAAAAIFDGWRSHFFGRTGIQLWWGALDVALILFNGKHASAPTDRGYLMKYDLDAELMNVGLYFGDEQTPPFFYGYISPEPPGAASLAIGPQDASWSTALHEWVLPYETVRRDADPARALRAFLDAIYAQCIAAAGWDRDALAYDPPKRPQLR